MKRFLYDKNGKIHMGSALLIVLVASLIAAPIAFSFLVGLLSEISGGAIVLPVNFFGNVQGRLTQSLAYVLNILIILWLWMIIYKKPLYMMGLSMKNFLKEMIFGLGFGLACFSMVYLIMYVLGGVRVLGFNAQGLFSSDTLSYMILFTFVGIYEELLGRGYIMYALGARLSKHTTIVLSAIFFSVLHSGNNGISLLPMLNIFLVGVLFALMLVKTGRLWISIGFHIIWNFAQGSIFGLNVSGIKTASSVFLSEPTGSTVVNGGVFGPEGGIVVTLVVLAGIAYFHFFKWETV